jgi:hypothetical protein
MIPEDDGMKNALAFSAKKESAITGKRYNTNTVS